MAGTRARRGDGRSRDPRPLRPRHLEQHPTLRGREPAPQPERGEAERDRARGGTWHARHPSTRPARRARLAAREAQRRGLHWGVAKDAETPDNDEEMAADTRIPENPFTEDAAAGESSDSISSLSKAIQEHLDLKQRNAGLDTTMPLDRYSLEDPFENHPLFKSEEQARLEETLEGVEAPTSESQAPWPGRGGRTRGPRARRGPLGSLARLRLGRVVRTTGARSQLVSRA